MAVFKKKVNKLIQGNKGTQLVLVSTDSPCCYILSGRMHNDNDDFPQQKKGNVPIKNETPLNTHILPVIL